MGEEINNQTGEMMNEKKKKIKFRNRLKGRVTRSPETVLMLNEFEKTGSGEILKRILCGVFKRARTEKAVRMINSMPGIFLSGGKRTDDIEILRSN